MSKTESPRVLRIHENDPVAVALSSRSPGDEAFVQGSPDSLTVQVEDPSLAFSVPEADGVYVPPGNLA